MRLALKSTLAFAAIYLVVVGAAGIWMAAQLRTLGRNTARITAQLLGGEVARTLGDLALGQLQHPEDAATLGRLEQMVEDVTQNSTILTSIAVVDRNGTVIAGDHIETGRQLALPDVIFGADRSVRLLHESFGGGSFYMLVPLESPDALLGYLRMEMRSRPIAQLYAEAIRNLLLVAIGGLLAVGSLGLVLHSQLSNRSAMLARALEGAVRGDTGPAPPQDEFAGAIEVARQVGRELNEVRGERLQLERRMEAVMRALDAGVVVLEPDLHVTSANDRAAELLGCADGAEVQARWRAGVAAQLSDLRRRFNGNGPAMGEIALVLPPEGRRLSVELYALGDRASAGYVALLKSADSLAALQAELGLAIQMRGLMRFYAAFAHDLKAPLNAMVMTLELLKMSVQSAGNDEAIQAKQTKYLTVLNDEIHRLDRQLRTLLSHTAPPSDVQEPVDLRTVLQEIEALLAPQARRQRVTLVSTVPDTPIVVVGQKDRLKQALLNILINALEAMPEGGALTTHLEPQDGIASLTIHDDGPGIPPETLQSIYDMHFTTKSGGTGVGLYVARSVVRSHGGSIDVLSAPETGTTFVLRLPMVGAGEPARPVGL